MRKIIVLAVLLAASSFAQAQFIQNLAKAYNGIGDFNDRFTCIAHSAEDKIIAAGSAVQTGQSRDVFVVKYTVTGVVEWQYTFNGSGNGADEAAAIVTDAQNNIYITGYQKGAGVGNDIITLKINAAGALQWATVYNSLYNEADQGVSIALDATGAVLVAANSDRDSTTTSNDDIVTIKYDAATGAQMWLQRFNGIGNSSDRPVRVLADVNNNVFVTGRTFNGNNDDYITIKYNASGTQQWAKTEDRTGNDRPTDMGLDANGDVYVTGRSKVTNYDFYTVKYNNTTGTRNWAKTYNSLDDDRATCLTIDAIDNIYVGGQVDVNANTATNIYDFGMVKYNSAGVQQWAKVIANTATDDVPSSIQTIVGGTVVMTGYALNTTTGLKDILTIELRVNTGVLDGSRLYNNTTGNRNDEANAITIDNFYDICIAGSAEAANGQKNALFLKYNTLTAAQPFEKIEQGTGDNSDNCRAMTTDAAGNIYMAGYRTAPTDRDFAVWKINTTGDTVWTRSLNGTSSYSSDEAVSIALDATNNVYITGSAKNTGANYDIVTIKMDNNGAILWQKIFDYNTLKQNDKAEAMKLDAVGNVYIVGRTDVNASSYTNDDALFLSYTSAGVQRFVQKYNGASNENDRFTHIEIAANSNVYAIGRTFAATNNDDILIQKYSANGVLQWTQTQHHDAADIVTATALDAAENLHIAATTGNSLAPNTIILKYNSAGVQQWLAPFMNSNIFSTIINAIGLDATNNLYAAGSVNTANAAAINKDALLIKLLPTGAIDYIFNPLTPNTNSDELTCIAIDANNNVLTAGTRGMDINKCVILNMHDTNGLYLTQKDFYGTAQRGDIPNVMRIANGFVYVAGSTQSVNAGRDALLLRYDYTRPVATKNIALTQNDIKIYPNPFGNEITFEMLDATDVNDAQISIYNMYGQAIAFTSVSANHTMTLSLNDVPSGCYFYSIKTKTGSICKGKIMRL